jgi:biopolymer transport protein TolQ
MEELTINANLTSQAIDFSLLSLFLRADLVVKSVIVILIITSVYSWTIIIGKLVRINRLKQLDKEFDEIFWSGNSFEDLYETFQYNQNDSKTKIFCSAIEEWRKSNRDASTLDLNGLNSLKERMSRSMQVTFNKESEIVEKNLTFLATAGSTAPFIGLFGTVWGIMNSFKSIAIAQNTNLSVVAPGIAEALFATALGLFVAIPAVVAYNKIASDLSKYFISMETFMDEFTTIFFRQLEEK